MLIKTTENIVVGFKNVSGWRVICGITEEPAKAKNLAGLAVVPGVHTIYICVMTFGTMESGAPGPPYA